MAFGDWVQGGYFANDNTAGPDSGSINYTGSGATPPSTALGGVLFTVHLPVAITARNIVCVCVCGSKNVVTFQDNANNIWTCLSLNVVVNSGFTQSTVFICESIVGSPTLFAVTYATAPQFARVLFDEFVGPGRFDQFGSLANSQGSGSVSAVPTQFPDGASGDIVWGSQMAQNTGAAASSGLTTVREFNAQDFIGTGSLIQASASIPTITLAGQTPFGTAFGVTASFSNLAPPIVASSIPPPAIMIGTPLQGLQQIGYLQQSISSATTLSIPQGTTLMVLSAEGNAIRWRSDGTSPTATVGQPLAVLQPLLISMAGINFQVVPQTGSATINASFYR